MSEIAELNESNDTPVSQSLGQTAFWDKVFQAVDKGSADVVLGRDKLSRDDKKNKYGLIGIPFVITKLTYQPLDDDYPDSPGYVSLEASIFPKHFVVEAIERGWTGRYSDVTDWQDETGLRPDSLIVINDGSKGVRRTVTEMLHNAGLVDVGDPDGEWVNPFDKPWTLWTHFQQSETRRDDDGAEFQVPSFTKKMDGGDIFIISERGLRASKAPDAPAGHSDTFFLS